MKQVYSNFDLATGPHEGGICKVTFIPREWVAERVQPDFLTGIVTGPLELADSRNWIELNLVDETYDFQEKPKTSKNGDYFETSISGDSNILDSSMIQKLESIRNHEVIAIVMDKKKNMRIVGHNDKAMKFSYGIRETNNQAWYNKVSIELTIQMPTSSPYYSV